jgi:predicted MFS family arabinose efflux permease
MMSDRTRLYRSLVITFFFTCYLAAAYGLGLYLFAVLLPDMRQELGFDYRAVGLMSGAAQLGYMIAALIAGPLTPRLGAIRLVFLSILAAGLGLVAMSTIWSTWLLGAVLILLAAVAASIWVPMVEVVSRFVPAHRRALVFGIFSSAGGYGALINGLLVPPLLVAIGWRAVWRDLGLITLALTAIGYIALRRLMVTGTKSQQRTRSSALINRDVLLTLFRSRRVLMLWALSFCISLGYLPFQTYLAVYLRGELGYSVAATGHLWTAFGAAAAIGGTALGLLADRIGIRHTILITLGLLLLAALLMAFPIFPGLPLLAAGAFGVSYGAMYGLTPAYVVKMLPPEHGSAIFGFGNVMIGIGGILGNLLAGYSQDLTGGLRAIYIGVAVAAVCLLMLAWRFDDDRHPA